MGIRIKILTVAAALAVPALASAQSSSINTYSPYTLYGLGDLHQRGAANMRTMGGVGVGYRAFNNPSGFINTMNPASLSVLPRKTFHFNMGLEGGNYYLSDEGRKTSFNTFNVNDISFAMPLAGRLGFGVSVAPYSSVGYRVKVRKEVPVEFYEQGAIGLDNLYSGSGDVTQAKLSLGWAPLKRLSVGVDMLYDFGRIERLSATDIIMRDPDATYNNLTVSQTEKVSRILWNFGLQYDIIKANERILTLGAVFSPETKLNPEVATSISNGTGIAQPLNNGLSDQMRLPNDLSAGLFYQTWRLGVGVDYQYQGWASANDGLPTVGEGATAMSLRNTNAFRAGFEFTPSRHDARRALKRVTYRAGVRYGDYYMTFGGREITDRAATVGFGIPFRESGFSYLDLGVELGQRGGKGLLKENYLKVSVGFRLLGEGWFRKLMYN